MRIVFRNLEKSEIAREAVEERLGDMVEKFPKLKNHKIIVTLFMENSPAQPGPDSFGVKVLIQGNFFSTISLCKTSPSLYLALADVREHMLEVLNRFGDKARVAERSQERKHRAVV
jgi:ribosome-associated translation inhibitor RaiA